MRRFLGLAIIMMSIAVCASAQTAAANKDRKQYVDDKNVTLRVEKIPAEASTSFSPHTSYSYALDDYKPGVVKVGPRTTYLKEGLTPEEVVRLLGKPKSVTERQEGSVVVATYVFQRGDNRILIAEFNNRLLARSRVESQDEKLSADR